MKHFENRLDFDQHSFKIEQEMWAAQRAAGGHIVRVTNDGKKAFMQNVHTNFPRKEDICQGNKAWSQERGNHYAVTLWFDIDECVVFEEIVTLKVTNYKMVDGTMTSWKSVEETAIMHAFVTDETFKNALHEYEQPGIEAAKQDEQRRQEVLAKAKETGVEQLLYSYGDIIYGEYHDVWVYMQPDGTERITRVNYA